MARNFWRRIKSRQGSPLNLDERVLRRRKTMVTAIIALTVMILFGFIAGSWQFLRQMGTFLEEELGLRLRSVATLTAKIIEESGEFPYFLEPEEATLLMPGLEGILRRVQEQNQLQGIYLVDPSLRSLAASPDIFSFGERLTFLEEDSLWVRQAATGVPAVAPLQLLAGNRFKSAYAPVFGPVRREVVALVAVQANAGFLDLIGTFQNGLIVGGAVSTALALLFSGFLFWAIRLLVRTHESLRRTERLAAMGQMAATVAHEIRNPLGIIKSTADVLHSKYGSQNEPDELFDFIPSEVRRLNRLVTDFLNFARDRDLEPEASDLRATVNKTLDSLHDELRKAKVELKTEMDELPPVKHDQDALNQVLLNLTLNAVQSMNGGGVISVRLKNAERKGRKMVRVEVQDTGCGFEAASDTIFEPFYTTKTSGSGLGLAVCKRIVEKHGGWIDVKSEKGKGTKMWFCLPT